MNWLHFIIACLLLANVVTFIAYGIDKFTKLSVIRKQINFF